MTRRQMSSKVFQPRKQHLGVGLADQDYADIAEALVGVVLINNRDRRIRGFRFEFAYIS